MHSKKFMVVFLLCWANLSSAASAEWQLEMQSRGVYLYSRALENGLIEVQAQTQIASHQTALLHLLNDIAEGPNWIDHAQKVELLAQPKPEVSIVHTYFSSPWPIRDRDMVTRSVIVYDAVNQQIDISVYDLGDAYPPTAGYVRMAGVQGVWNISPSSGDTIKISYTGTGNPKGNIPHWLANRLLKRATFNTFVAMQAKLSEPKYQKEHHEVLVENKNL